MLSMEEQAKLRKILSMISEDVPEKVSNGPNVSNRLRDQQGRFLPDKLKLRNKEELPLRSIKVVKVKGTYGTYLIKDRIFDESAFHMLITLGTIAILTILF